jgi:hypothetical protein
MHIGEAPGIRLESASRVRASLRVVGIPGILPEFRFFVAEAITLGASGSAGIFPLSLGGEAVLFGLFHLVELSDKVLGVIPGNILHRAILTAFLKK